MQPSKYWNDITWAWKKIDKLLGWIHICSGTGEQTPWRHHYFLSSFSLATESEGKSSRVTLIIFSLPVPFLSDSLHCSQLCQDCDKLNYQWTVGIPDDISMVFSFFWLHESFLVFTAEWIRTGSRWCWCPKSAASEPLSPRDLQWQDKMWITKPPGAMRFGLGDSENGIVHGQAQICHLGRCHLPTCSWKSGLISGLLTAVTAEPRALAPSSWHGDKAHLWLLHL